MTAAQRLAQARADARRLLIEAADEARREAFLEALREERGFVQASLAALHGETVTVPDPWTVGGLREVPTDEEADTLRQRLDAIDAEIGRIEAEG